jgi:hypothetical protein
MLPSLGRSFSRKTKTATPAKAYLGERAVNRGDENVRPGTSESEGYGSLKGSRPNTGSSAESQVSCDIQYGDLQSVYSDDGEGTRQSKEPRTRFEDSLRTANSKAAAGEYGAEAEAAILYMLWCE